jgi:hypothetical protein
VPVEESPAIEELAAQPVASSAAAHTVPSKSREPDVRLMPAKRRPRS